MRTQARHNGRSGIEWVRTAVVGAGPAGLAASRELLHAGVKHVVLERGRIGWSWRTQRWDSFRLNTPVWMNRVPGEFLEGPADSFATADELVAALEALRGRPAGRRRRPGAASRVAGPRLASRDDARNDRRGGSGRRERLPERPAQTALRRGAARGDRAASRGRVPAARRSRGRRPRRRRGAVGAPDRRGLPRRRPSRLRLDKPRRSPPP